MTEDLFGILIESSFDSFKTPTTVKYHGRGYAKFILLLDTLISAQINATKVTF